MQALVTTPSAPWSLVLGDAPDPVPGSDEALVEVRATSLNRGEVRGLARRRPGEVPGWDVAGVVLEAAADGTGPAVGTRVVGLVESGAWAERAAVPTHVLAELPEAVSFEAASVLPIAGITAVRTLGVGGLLLGRRVAITGAAGGVGRLAVQLAARAGAHVTGVAHGDRAAGLPELGADEIVPSLEGDGERFDLVLESAGGASLAAALGRIAAGGTVVTFGNSSGEETTFNVSTFYGSAHGASLRAFLIFPELRNTRTGSRDLRALAELVARGELDPHVSAVGSWRDPEPLLTALMERRIQGKAVLRVDGGG
jgi:NADPH:quinone reductase-like Zn-dependent oxidoreductase